jgi:hypothetical protein
MGKSLYILTKMGKVGLPNKFLSLFPQTKKQPALCKDRLLFSLSGSSLPA